jgi:hypothetical protein
MEYEHRFFNGMEKTALVVNFRKFAIENTTALTVDDAG